MIAVDCKTFALHGGGISHFFAPLLEAWTNSKNGSSLLLIGPKFDSRIYGIQHASSSFEIKWPSALPRHLRHPFYDNVLFPRAIRTARPAAVFSPYHDVRLPSGVRNVMTIHDLCIEDLVNIYPRTVRGYYIAMLRRNLKVAEHIVTVSNTTRMAVIERYNWPEDRISVVYNTVSSEFSYHQVSERHTTEWRDALEIEPPLLLYTAGIEYRKNLSRLLGALELLGRNGTRSPALLVTGDATPKWSTLLAGTTEGVRNRVHFLGYLSIKELRAAYGSVDAVVYPTLGEGFGRPCLESMVAGTPLACSDLPVLREIAGEYPIYFDPWRVESIAEGIEKVLSLTKRPPVRDPRFEPAVVSAHFVELMNGVLG